MFHYWMVYPYYFHIFFFRFTSYDQILRNFHKKHLDNSLLVYFSFQMAGLILGLLLLRSFSMDDYPEINLRENVWTVKIESNLHIFIYLLIKFAFLKKKTGLIILLHSKIYQSPVCISSSLYYISTFYSALISCFIPKLFVCTSCSFHCIIFFFFSQIYFVFLSFFEYFILKYNQSFSFDVKKADYIKRIDQYYLNSFV